MEMEELAELDVDDQWLILLGRIAKETVWMETQLRGLHAWLHHGEAKREHLFTTPRAWRDLHKQTREKVASLPVESGIRDVILDTVAAAHKANDGRNKYMHRELVRHEQWDTEQPPPSKIPIYPPGGRLQIQISTTSGIPAPEPVTLEQAHALVSELIGVGWRLRFARLHLESGGGWMSELTAHVTGTWDGNADLVGGQNECDDE